jgi:hypothetical protein
MCNSLFLEESEERRKCFLNVRLMFAKIRGIFEMNKVFNKNIISVITMWGLSVCVLVNYRFYILFEVSICFSVFQ